MPQQSARAEIQILHFEDRHQADFERLNRAWIEKHFVTAPIDERQLTMPRAEFIEPGGAILIAERNGVAVGAVALMMKRSDDGDEFELGKMSVAESERGNGIGAALMEAAIVEARQRGVQAITLLSNTMLVPAIRLYEKFGFKQIPLDPDVPYDQVNIAMKLQLA